MKAAVFEDASQMQEYKTYASVFSVLTKDLGFLASNSTEHNLTTAQKTGFFNINPHLC